MPPLLGWVIGGGYRFFWRRLLLPTMFVFQWNSVQAQTPPPSGQPYANGVAAAASAAPQGLRFSPSLTVSEVFSDNVGLAASGSARSEWTTRIRPAITMSENSARLHFNATYSPELIHRAVQGTTDVYHYLNAIGTAELWSRRFFLDVSGAVTQQNVSLLSPQADGNLNTSTNRTDTKTYSISPYLRHEFGFDALGELRFTHDAVHYGGNSSGSSSSTAERLEARLSSGPAFKLFVWNIAASKSHLEYQQTGQKIDAQNYSFFGGRLITPELRLNANVGYQDNGYASTSGSSSKGKFWSVGPEWTPTERTRFAASFGRQYYGPWRTLQLSHRSSRTAWRLDYNESVATTRGSLSVPVTTDTASQLDQLYQNQFPDPVVRQAVVQALITALGLPATLTQPLNFLTDNFYLDKRLQGNMAVEGVRNVVVASLFTANRTSLTTSASGRIGGDFNSSNNIKQLGANVTWSSRLSQTLSTNVGVTAYRYIFSSVNRTDHLTTYVLGLTKQFSPKFTGTLSLTRRKNDSDVASSDYTENSLAATLSLRY